VESLGGRNPLEFEIISTIAFSSLDEAPTDNLPINVFSPLIIWLVLRSTKFLTAVPVPPLVIDKISLTSVSIETLPITGFTTQLLSTLKSCVKPFIVILLVEGAAPKSKAVGWSFKSK